jgi:hypothetical protein
MQVCSSLCGCVLYIVHTPTHTLMYRVGSCMLGVCMCCMYVLCTVCMVSVCVVYCIVGVCRCCVLHTDIHVRFIEWRAHDVLSTLLVKEHGVCMWCMHVVYVCVRCAMCTLLVYVCATYCIHTCPCTVCVCDVLCTYIHACMYQTDSKYKSACISRFRVQGLGLRLERL